MVMSQSYVSIKGLLTDHVEASRVSVEGHVLFADLDVVVGVDTMRSHEEAEYPRLWVHLLDHVEDTHNDVMSSGRLTSTEHQCHLQPCLIQALP